MLVHISVWGQTPEKMSYQAVIRDTSGALLNQSNVGLKIIIRQGSPNGSNVYEETHQSMTNEHGLISLEIGSGFTVNGFFNEIDWTQGPFFIETLVDPEGNSNYKINGVSEMLSVPFALHAKSADSFTGEISPSQMPDFYTADEVDGLLEKIQLSGGANQSFKLNRNYFEDWDTNAADDFSGVYDDLQNLPELYNKTEIDNLIDGIETNGGSPQILSMEGSTLSISGGNSVSFDNYVKHWDTNAADDFSGMYNDLQNKPDLYNKTEIDNLIDGIETTGGSPQDLSLEGSTLSISGGNSISMENWDTDSTDDFDGEYSSLTGAPKVYTQEEVDDIKAEILKDMTNNYVKKAKVISFTNSRNVNQNDVGNTIACIYSTTLTLTSGFSAMKVGDVINVEVHGTTLTVNGTSGVLINGEPGGYTSIGNDEVYSGGIIRKTGNNSYIVL